MASSDSPRDESRWDPLFLHARREAIVILVAWAACFVWSVTYCTQVGYGVSPEELQTLWGMPRWVIFGIVLPWLAADLFAVWFCFFFMVDDDLGETAEGLGIEEELAQMRKEADRKAE